MFKKTQLSLALAASVFISANVSASLDFADDIIDLRPYAAGETGNLNELVDEALAAHQNVVIKEQALDAATGTAVAAAQDDYDAAVEAKAGLTGPVVEAAYAYADANWANSAILTGLDTEITTLTTAKNTAATAFDTEVTSRSYAEIETLRAAADAPTATVLDVKNLAMALDDVAAATGGSAALATADAAASELAAKQDEKTEAQLVEVEKLYETSVMDWRDRVGQVNALLQADKTTEQVDVDAKQELLDTAQTDYDTAVAKKAEDAEALAVAEAALLEAERSTTTTTAELTTAQQAYTSAKSSYETSATAATTKKGLLDTATANLKLEQDEVDALDEEIALMSAMVAASQDERNPAGQIIAAVAADEFETESVISAVSTNYGYTQENAANIAINSDNIASNLALINQNSNSIDQLNDDVDILRSGVASALALAGMPMTPGDGWGASVGTGYFDGESAIAAGLTYKAERYNFKFGVGSSGGETSASAGFSFDLK